MDSRPTRPALRVVTGEADRPRFPHHTTPGAWPASTRRARHLALVDRTHSVDIDVDYFTYIALAMTHLDDIAAASVILDRECGYTPGTYLSWCRGETLPELHDLNRLAVAVDRPVTLFTSPEDWWEHMPWRSPDPRHGGPTVNGAS